MWVSESGDSTWSSASFRGEGSPMFVVTSLHMENGVSKLSGAVCAFWEDHSRDVRERRRIKRHLLREHPRNTQGRDNEKKKQRWEKKKNYGLKPLNRNK